MECAIWCFNKIRSNVLDNVIFFYHVKHYFPYHVILTCDVVLTWFLCHCTQPALSLQFCGFPKTWSRTSTFMSGSSKISGTCCSFHYPLDAWSSIWLLSCSRALVQFALTLILGTRRSNIRCIWSSSLARLSIICCWCYHIPTMTRVRCSVSPCSLLTLMKDYMDLQS